MFGRRRNLVSVEELTEKHFRESRCWEFCNDDKLGELMMRPVEKLPVSDSANKLFGTELVLADGSPHYGYLGNVSLKSMVNNRHFLTVSLYVAGEIQHLARYHDIDANMHGSAWLATLLKKREDDIFPIRYDLAGVAAGVDACIHGIILKEPTKKLTRSEIIQLAVSGQELDSDA